MTEPSGQAVLMPIFLAKAGFREDMERELRAVQETSLSDEGCLAYRIFQDAQRPERFVLHEEWADTEAWEAHSQQPHVKRFKRVIEEWLDGPIELTELKSIV